VFVAPIVRYGGFAESVRCGAPRASGGQWRNKRRYTVTIGVFASHGGLRA
jgi:hypothetical protein